jgi:hypothetical protein
MVLVTDRRLITRNGLATVVPQLRRSNVLLDSALPVLLIISIASGWIASLLGLTEFGLHKYSSMALLFVAALHVFRYRRMLLSHLRLRRRAAQVWVPTARPHVPQRNPAPEPGMQIVDAQTARVLAEWLRVHPEVRLSIHLVHQSGAQVLEYPSPTESAA